MSLQSQFFLYAVVGSVLFMGIGCTPNQPPKVDSVVFQEPELNTPYLEDQQEQEQLKDLLDNSYFFVVENKKNDFGKNSEYGILAVRTDCSTFSPVQLSQNNVVVALRKLKNKPILLQNFEAYQGEFTLKDIQEDMIHVRDIERLKKTCTEPFDRYVK